MDQLPALVGDHEQACVARGDAELRRRRQHRIVVLGDGEAAPCGRSAAAEERKERAALEAVRLAGRVDVQDLEEGRDQVDRLDQLIAYRAARAIGFAGWIVDDERHLHRGLVEQVLVAHPVIAQVVAVIGGEHDHGALE